MLKDGGSDPRESYPLPGRSGGVGRLVQDLGGNTPKVFQTLYPFSKTGTRQVTTGHSPSLRQGDVASGKNDLALPVTLREKRNKKTNSFRRRGSTGPNPAGGTARGTNRTDPRTSPSSPSRDLPTYSPKRSEGRRGW